MALPARVFCDTSFFYATLDPDDTYYERAGDILDEIVAARTRLLTTWDVISETITLLRYRMGFRAALGFLADIEPTLRLVHYGDRTRAAAEQVFRQRARDHRLSFCDALSFVVVTTLLDHMVCVAFDDDFQALGLTVIR